MIKERIPPHQVETKKFPVLHIGGIPGFDPATWDFEVNGLVDNPLKLSHAGFSQLPRSEVIADFHCVTRWSRLDNRWEGVKFKDLIALVKPAAEARFVTVVCEGDYTTSLPLADLSDENIILADTFNGTSLEPAHGWPLRLVVPKKYAYKSAKWVRRLNFTAKQELGYWEQRGYSNSADPWKEERHS